MNFHPVGGERARNVPDRGRLILIGTWIQHTPQHKAPNVLISQTSLKGRDIGKEVLYVLPAQTQIRHRRMRVGDKCRQHVGIRRKFASY